MKSVLRSVKSYWIYCILEGLKKIEVGKDFPKADDWDRTVFLYCSKDRKSLNRIPIDYRAKYEKLMGKVVCEFTCDKVEKMMVYNSDSGMDYHFVGNSYISDTALSDYEILEYGKGKPLYGWHISALVIYDTPKELSEFSYAKFSKRQYNETFIDFVNRNNHIKKAPQSWCYVEEV